MVESSYRAFIDELLSRIDILDCVRPYLQLKRRGMYFVACCPFHQEKTPSFYVFPTKQRYHCFGCGVGGDVIHFIQAIQGVDFKTAISQLAGSVNMTLPSYSPRQEAKDKLKEVLLEALAQMSHYYQGALRKHAPAIEYLKGRGMSGEVCGTYALGYAPGGEYCRALNIPDGVLQKAGLLSGRWPKFSDRVMFPIRNIKGEVLGFGGRTMGDEHPKYLNSPTTEVFHKSEVLYGLYECIKHRNIHEPLYLVEGYMDVLALANVGCFQALATLGTAPSASHIRLLWRYTDKLVLCFDGDAAGVRAAMRALSHALPTLTPDRLLKLVLLPQGEDPDSCIAKGGLETMQQRFNAAEDWPDWLLAQLRGDDHSLSARVQWVRAALQAVEGLDVPLLYESFLEKLSLLSGFTREQLRGYREKPMQSTPEKAFGTKLPDDPVLFAIGILLGQPELATAFHFNDAQRVSQLPHGELLLSILEQLRNSPDWTAARLLNHWRGEEGHELLSQLVGMDFPSWKPEEAKDSWVGLMRKVEQLALTRVIEGKLDKARRGELTNDDREELLKLMSEKAQLQKSLLQV